MDFKELLSRGFVDGHIICEKFCFDSLTKINEELGEVAEEINNGSSENLGDIFKELMDVAQAAYSCVIAHEKVIGIKRTEILRKEWLEKQVHRIREYNGTERSHKELPEKVLEKIATVVVGGLLKGSIEKKPVKMSKEVFTMDGKIVKLTEEQARLCKSILRTKKGE